MSVGVDSVDLIRFCLEYGVLYVDASLEAWGDELMDQSIAPEERSIYAYRSKLLLLKDETSGKQGLPTAGEFYCAQRFDVMKLCVMEPILA